MSYANFIKKLGIVILVTSIFTYTVLNENVINADNINTSVNVGNGAPTFSVNPVEVPVSNSANPTQAAETINFQATANDFNNENYYLAICKTNQINPVNESSPSCPGGQWCISNSTVSSSQASCAYTTSGADSTTNIWYAFACDHSASSACSTANQGSGASGSPFEVNHSPVYDDQTSTNNTNVTPGGVVTVSVPINEITDQDNDQARLIVCKDLGIANGDCAGGVSQRWCVTDLATLPSAFSCQFTLPSVLPDTIYVLYAHALDEHGKESGAVYSTTFSVPNVPPNATTIVLDEGIDIILTEGGTTNIGIDATINDSNSCQDISSVTVSVYRSGVGSSGCDQSGESNSNYCYPLIPCTPVTSGNTCSGTSDGSVEYECTTELNSNADPTDTATPYQSQHWVATVRVTDDDSSVITASSTTPVDVLSLVALNVPNTTLDYGNLLPGGGSTSLDKSLNITSSGNTAIDLEISGQDLISGSNIIPITNHKFSLNENVVLTSTSTEQVTTSPTEFEANISKTTNLANPSNRSLWWGIIIPITTLPGNYAGSVTFSAVKAEVEDW